jgi:hypothetical protein
MTGTDASSPFRWSDWIPLAGRSRNPAIPTHPGLYRVRIAGAGDIIYIGQTGRSLRERLGALSTCYRPEMPYRDPHTAAPALWSLRDRDGVDFEVSTTEVDASKVERLALEALAITLHRVEHGSSPLVNFSGRIAGYRLSSSNTSALVAAGKRFRGGIDPSAAGSVSAPVPGPIDGDVVGTDWLGLSWAPWTPIEMTNPTGTGLYRLRRRGSDELLYVGQGRIGSRIRNHHAKRDTDGHRQADHFSGEVDASWTELQVDTRILLEYENDAIASHRLARGVAPLAQFIG